MNFLFFNLTYFAEELSLYHQGKTADLLVRKYLKLLKESQIEIFITPYWWNSIAGMSKGFIDKVIKEVARLTHIAAKTGVKGELNNDEHCNTLTTSTSPTWYIRLFLSNAIKKIFIDKILKQLEFRNSNISWQNFGGIINSSIEQRKNI